MSSTWIRSKRRTVALATVATLVVAVAAFGLSNAAADVTPPSVTATLAPGESLTVEKTVTLPAVPPKLDLVLDVDLSGSYGDDLPNIKALSPGIFDAVRAGVADSEFGLVSFVDYPFSPWGASSTGDYAYQRDQDLTADKTTWVNSVNAMTLHFGGDEPESQLESLYQAATGAGRDVSPPGASLGDVPAGQGIGFRADATKVVAMTTDASFHVAGDSLCVGPAPPCPFPYPGPSFADTVTALNGAGVKVIAIKAPGSTTQMDDIAAATGGAVTTTGSSSAEIADAILGALEELTFTVTGNPVGCAPLDISFSPTSHTGVAGGSTVVFSETITVPPGTTGVPSVTCTVEFKADDTVIGVQTITISIVQEVGIDIKPGSFPNSIKLSNKGVIPVAILSTPTFDATTVDANTVCFGDAEDPSQRDCTEAHGRGHIEDVNGDFLLDLVLHFETSETGIDLGDTEACLTGETFGGALIEGCDSVRTL
jgi:Integrin beta chain VWA domain